MPQPGDAECNDGYYELRQTTNRGLGAFALRDIVAGTRILIDNALFVIPKNANYVDDEDIIKAYHGASPVAKKMFDNLPCFCPQWYDDWSRRWLGRFESNKFDSSPNGPWGCFAHASRFNHSCVPNCNITSLSDDRRQCYVFKNVAAGEELTFSYSYWMLHLPFDKRQEMMIRELILAPCQCDLCSLPSDQRRTSEMRRHMMLYLIYLFRNDPPMFPMGKKNISFLKAQNHFESFRNINCIVWPYIMFTYLAEAEGVQHGILVRRCFVLAIVVVLERVDSQNVHLGTIAWIRQWANNYRRLRNISVGAKCNNELERMMESQCVLVDDVVTSVKEGRRKILRLPVEDGNFCVVEEMD